MTRSGVDCCTGIALTILCGPCICLYFGLTACFCPSRLRRRPCVHDPKANFEKRQRSAPRPALRRKRALTLPLPENSSGVLSEKPTQRTYDQKQSRLFKLPLELREQIYREVLSGPPIHIIRKQKKLGHLRCKAIRPEDCPVKYEFGGRADSRQTCWGLTDNVGVWCGRSTWHEPTDGGILPLLRSCRRMHVCPFQ